MRYSLRTLLIIMLLGGPLLAWGWRSAVAWWEWRTELAAAQTVPVKIVPWQGSTSTNPLPIAVELDGSGSRVTTRSLHELGALPEQQVPGDPWEKLLELPAEFDLKLEVPPGA